MSKPPTMKPPTGKPALNKPALSKPSAKPQTPTRTAKNFTVRPLSSHDEGEKILLYGKSGIGKTTLAAQLDDATFIAIDDGARKVCNPITGKPVSGIPEVETFDDLRDAVRQATKLLPEKGKLVIDTITRVEPLVSEWVLENVPLEKGGKARNIEAYGFGKGYRHILDAVRCLLSDFDALIRSGRSVILLGQLDQAIVANSAGADYYSDVPKLVENKQGPVRTEVCEWVDHILRIGYLEVDVSAEKDARAGKVQGSATRAIFTGGAQHFIAKTRPVSVNRSTPYRIPEVISFESVEDCSLWQYVYGGAVEEGGA